MRQKICQIIPTLVQGGAEKQMALLASHLDRERFESHVIVLTYTGPLEEELRKHGVQVHLIGKRGKFDPTALYRLIQKLRQIAPQVVHTWLFAANSYGRYAAQRARVPVIIAGERCVDPWKRWWHFAIDKKLAKKTDTIVTNTAAVSNFYAAHGIDESHFTVIPNAVLTGNTENRLTRAELFERLHIPPRGRVVGAVGRLWKQKGYPELIWAAELLHVAHPDVYLIIVGDGPERRSLMEYRDKVGAQDSVRFVGHRSDAQELISGFDLLWNGSLYEGQSNTILEAMQLGVPVIASNIPGNRDLVLAGQTGYLFRPGDASMLVRSSLELLNNDSRRSEMGQLAKKLTEQKFSLQNMVSAHEALYTRLLGKHL